MSRSRSLAIAAAFSSSFFGFSAYGNVGIHYGSPCNLSDIVSETMSFDLLVVAAASDGFPVSECRQYPGDPNDPFCPGPSSISVADSVSGCNVTANFDSIPIYSISEGQSEPGYGSAAATASFAASRGVIANCDSISMSISGAALATATISNSDDALGCGASAGVNFSDRIDVSFCVIDPGTVTIEGILSASGLCYSGPHLAGNAKAEGTIILTGPPGIFWTHEFDCATGTQQWNDSFSICPGVYVFSILYQAQASIGGSINPFVESSDSGTSAVPGTSYVHASMEFEACLGDVNGDGIVDLADFSLLLASFGTSQGQPGFNPNADIDHDGDVDMSDLSLLLANFGNSCEC